MRRRTLMCLPDRGCSATSEGSIGEEEEYGDCGAATRAIIGECGDIITFRRRIFLTDAGAPKPSSARDDCRRIAAAAKTAVIVSGRRNMICRKKGRVLKPFAGSEISQILTFREMGDFRIWKRGDG